MKAVCLNRESYLASLTVGKEYRVEFADHGLYRVWDDSGEDCLYPRDMFKVEARPRYCIKDKRANVEKRRAYMREYMAKLRAKKRG